MRKLSIAIAVSSICMAAQAQLIDDFSGDLSGWTSTVILDNNGGELHTSAWEISGGTLQLNTSATDGGVQQYAMIYGGLTLQVGYEVLIDLVHSGASQDIGLYVGGTVPTPLVREDYVAIYARDKEHIFSRGFDGTTEYGLVGGDELRYDSLFIARVAENTYEAGWYDNGVRNVLVTRTPIFANDADVIGLYADVRATGVLGNVDNFRIAVIPEPSTAALLGFGALGCLMRLRRRK